MAIGNSGVLRKTTALMHVRKNVLPTLSTSTTFDSVMESKPLWHGIDWCCKKIILAQESSKNDGWVKKKKNKLPL